MPAECNWNSKCVKPASVGCRMANILETKPASKEWCFPYTILSETEVKIIL